MNKSPNPHEKDPSEAGAAFHPLPSPIIDPAASAQHHAPQQPVQVAAPVADNNEIQVSHQDVLFGRGGQTNRHIGNLRYRDIIALHRADYVRASKVEKPNVARRIVKAIRTGKNPGRFLRKGDDGKWQEVSDKEASWKASQALREKTRWSSMKQQKAAQEIAQGSQKANEHAEKMVKKATKSIEKTTKKRKAKEEKASSSQKKAAVAVAVAVATEESILNTPTESSQISIPDMSPHRARVPVSEAASFAVTAGAITPRDEDVLFGRGGKTNHHPGNKRLREIVNSYRSIYRQAKKVDKPKVAKLIVGALRAASPPSRFLRVNETTNQWEDVGDRRASEKVSQSLREKDKNEREAARVAAAAAEDEEGVNVEGSINDASVEALV
mmetsp:Transcript_21245/g.30410  ORF Transcript_21245/g.30410 Transcript_21245/m.30410 type:complete len:383 (+) Transcript_21245:68-1216(+)|eukprot:CAMPEP_0201698894 /NCGR_PEP_ID=MMETSP0578-20130828/21404_1 /ASSEMBLY_ACC=CAM_ASM_000663 /TAXON_ID=267565 /ORGANISM="Skeletonema grethea, Strain CCMP 1804" /LENGTH=382 /DNA_ID=CAMNT_0048185537 /DNA_START=65 /DNA_END=1213 /DNA_ORIENTATION=-